MKIKIVLLTSSIIALTLFSIADSKAQTEDQHSSTEHPTTKTMLESAGNSLQNNHCEDSDEDMASCRSFIKGFLKGAILTDIAIIKSIDESAQETFAERAIKTRLNRRNDSPTELAGFCLPPDRTIADLAEETLLHVKSSKRDSHELARNVYNSLKTDFPCAP